jgi:hypothetical protein
MGIVEVIVAFGRSFEGHHVISRTLEAHTYSTSSALNLIAASVSDY